MSKVASVFFVLLVVTQVWAEPDTPGRNTALRWQPYENCFGNSTSFEAAMAANNYEIWGLRHIPGPNKPAFGLLHYIDWLTGVGHIWIETHGNTSMHDIETYDNEQSRNDAWQEWLYEGLNMAHFEKTWNAWGYAIAIKATSIPIYFNSNHTAIHNKSCGSASYASSWTGHRVHVGSSDEHAAQGEDNFYASIGQGNTFNSAVHGIMQLDGDGNTILAPRVVSEPPFNTAIPVSGLVAEWTFTGSMRGQVTGDAIVGVCGDYWVDDHTYQATLCAMDPGMGYVQGHFESNNGVPLVHSQDDWAFYVSNRMSEGREEATCCPNSSFCSNVTTDVNGNIREIRMSFETTDSAGVLVEKVSAGGVWSVIPNTINANNEYIAIDVDYSSGDRYYSTEYSSYGDIVGYYRVAPSESARFVDVAIENARLYNRLFVQGGDWQDIIDGVLEVEPLATASAQVCDYLIICQDDLISDIVPLCSYYESQGVSVRLVRSGQLLPEYARPAIHQLISESIPLGIASAMIVGVPRFRSGNAWKDYWLPSAIPGLQGDNAYYDVTGDYIPDINGGRLPAFFPEDVVIYINKVLRYWTEYVWNNAKCPEFNKHSFALVCDMQYREGGESAFSELQIDLKTRADSDLSLYTGTLGNISITRFCPTEHTSYQTSTPAYNQHVTDFVAGRRDHVNWHYSIHQGPAHLYSMVSPSSFTDSFSDLTQAFHFNFVCYGLGWDRLNLLSTFFYGEIEDVAGLQLSYGDFPAENHASHYLFYGTGIGVFGPIGITTHQTSLVMANSMAHELSGEGGFVDRRIGEVCRRGIGRSIADNPSGIEIYFGYEFLGDPMLRIMNVHTGQMPPTILVDEPVVENPLCSNAPINVAFHLEYGQESWVNDVHILMVSPEGTVAKDILINNWSFGNNLVSVRVPYVTYQDERQYYVKIVVDTKYGVFSCQTEDALTVFGCYPHTPPDNPDPIIAERENNAISNLMKGRICHVLGRETDSGIKYIIRKEAHSGIEVFDVRGRRIATKVMLEYVGEFVIATIDLRAVSSGVYFVRGGKSRETVARFVNIR